MSREPSLPPVPDGNIDHHDQPIEKSGDTLEERIRMARNEYFKMYEDLAAGWKIITFEEKFKELTKRLEVKGITFDETESVQLRVSLRTTG